MKLSTEALILVKNGLTCAAKKAENVAQGASEMVKDNPSKLNDPALEYFGRQEKQYFKIAEEILALRNSLKG